MKNNTFTLTNAKRIVTFTPTRNSRVLVIAVRNAIIEKFSIMTRKDARVCYRTCVRHCGYRAA